MKPGDVSAMYVAPLQKAMLYKYTNIQIYKYKYKYIYTNTNWIWLARVPLTHEADAATHRGGTSAPCM